MRPTQYFTDDYLAQCNKMSSQEILEFLENFRLLHLSRNPNKSKLISLKIPEELLNAFKAKAKLEGVLYQTQIKALMKRWL
jgi:predicted DNA binding CopG/RHH family protein